MRSVSFEAQARLWGKAAAEGAFARQGNPERTSVKRPKKILVVQPAGTTRLLLKALLETSGYSVISVSNSAEAIAAIGTEKPDLAAIDLSLDDSGGDQGQDGLKIIDWAQSNSSGRKIPFIVMSGDDQKLIMKRTQGIEMVLLLPKPIVPQELLAAVNAAIQPGANEGN